MYLLVSSRNFENILNCYRIRGVPPLPVTGSRITTNISLLSRP